jgi:hypothetical protein
VLFFLLFGGKVAVLGLGNWEGGWGSLVVIWVGWGFNSHFSRIFTLRSLEISNIQCINVLFLPIAEA